KRKRRFRRARDHRLCALLELHLVIARHPSIFPSGARHQGETVTINFLVGRRQATDARDRRGDEFLLLISWITSKARKARLLPGAGADKMLEPLLKGVDRKDLVDQAEALRHIGGPTLPPKHKIDSALKPDEARQILSSAEGGNEKVVIDLGHVE